MLEFSSAKHLVETGAVSKTKFSCCYSCFLTFGPKNCLPSTSLQQTITALPLCQSQSITHACLPACLPVKMSTPIYFSTGKIYGKTVLIFN